ncbi:MAG TPA: carboxypeptidase-like regulatory domain-containing protein [Puia sp.]|nr:carboxypeptidase-like regulatory domain-containing protein [Puia sp.]
MNAGLIRPFFFSLTALLLSSAVQSQDKFFIVSGKVLDGKTQQPLAGASVFCENTTVGTISKNDGRFSLRLNNGGYDMIVSYTGYETRSVRISKGSKENDSLTIELKEQDKSMSEVVVAGSAEVADGWNKYGQFFLDNFVGTTPNAAQCTLENKDAVKFYFYKKRNKLKIKAKDELVITNNALGYKIRYQLDSFVYDYSSSVSSYTGYPLFEELQGTQQQMEDWKQHRLNAYMGSRLHFMRSWYDSTLKEEGFVLEAADSSSRDKMTPVKDPYGSKLYNVDSGDVEVSLNGRLRVSYTNQAPDKKYLQERKFPLSMRAQISAIDIAGGFVIEENGYFYDQSDVINIGYWAWKKLAEVLPYDYLPPADLIQ